MGNESLHSRLKVTTRYLPHNFPSCSPEDLPEILQRQSRLLEKYPFLMELAEVELLLEASKVSADLQGDAEEYRVAPGVVLLQVSWSGLAELLNGREVIPDKDDELLLIVPQSKGGSPLISSADNDSLLALKIVTEALNIRTLAVELDVTPAYLQNVLRHGVAKGLIVPPATKIARSSGFAQHMACFATFLKTHGFTLQWHITQTCDLNCRHCYDRSERKDVSLQQGVEILDQFYEFCDHYHVQGQVTFTGGNPLLHPQFFQLYHAASTRGFKTALLANPTNREVLEKIVAIQMPECYQISLEGLAEHNDYIRGMGHFNRSMQFLELLRELKVYSMVMLTLTRENLNQVVALAEMLRDRVDSFTFNRLAMVGKGACLASVAPRHYREFLISYQVAAAKNPVMRFKDNLFNLVRYQDGLSFSGGCTGYGCGAAFNFVSLLPDGQVHACRKFPSSIGDINTETLIAVYEGEAAANYRKGSRKCFHCAIKPVCGGCLAVAHGFSKDPLHERDPYCFADD